MNRTNLYLEGKNLSSPYLADIKKDVTVRTPLTLFACSMALSIFKQNRGCAMDEKALSGHS